MHNGQVGGQLGRDAWVDRGQAIAHVIAQARAEDIVLIAGKGHEDYQIIGSEKLHYSDRETVIALLQEAP